MTAAPPPPDDQLELARWILDRNIAWIATAESKVAFVVAIDIAMAFASAGLQSIWTGPYNNLKTHAHYRTAWWSEFA